VRSAPRVRREGGRLRRPRQGRAGIWVFTRAGIWVFFYSTRIEVRDHRDIVVALEIRVLVDPDSAPRHRRPTRQAAADGALDDAVRFLPRHPQAAGHGGRRRFLEPGDRQPLEQERGVRVPLRPRHANRLHAVGVAADPRHRGMHPRRVLARVEVRPAPLHVIIDRRDGLALGTGERRPDSFLQPHINCFRPIIELHPHHLPRRTDPEDRRVQRSIVHSDPLKRKSYYAGRPTQFP